MVLQSYAFIIYWNGTDWATINNQLESEAHAVIDLATDGNGHLYIGDTTPYVGVVFRTTSLGFNLATLIELLCQIFPTGIFDLLIHPNI